MPDAPTPRERPTDDEAALREAVERLDGLPHDWRNNAAAYEHDARSVSDGSRAERVYSDRAAMYYADADALALVLRRVRETIDKEG